MTLEKSKKMKINNLLFVGLLSLLWSCGGNQPKQEATAANTNAEEKKEEVVNVYSHRFYDADKELFKRFEEKTGIKVNVKKDKDDKLIQLLQTEGENTQADVLVTVDAGRLYYATELDLLQSVTSEGLEKNVPENFRESDGYWYGLTKRARVIAYSLERVKPEQLSTYEALTNPEWKGKISIRSSGNIYNQSLMASIIANSGEEKALEWAKGIVANMWQEPKGNDRDQIKNIALGKADVALVNTYYMGKLLNSSNEMEKEAAAKVALFFPNQEDRGTHVNISGAGITKHAKNKENAVKLLEFLTSEEAQKVYAQSNYEYPVNANVEPSDLLKQWGDFKMDQIDLKKLGSENSTAVKIFKEANWK